MHMNYITTDVLALCLDLHTPIERSPCIYVHDDEINDELDDYSDDIDALVAGCVYKVQ